MSVTRPMKNITFSADENKIELAREVARSEQRTLNDAFRDWLDWYASRRVSRAEIEALFEKLNYADAGRKFTRDEMNER
jgi:predicted transcriptional regulator